MNDSHAHEFIIFQDGLYICGCGESITESSMIEDRDFLNQLDEEDSE
jgi:hypothetical protein